MMDSSPENKSFFAQAPSVPAARSSFSAKKEREESESKRRSTKGLPFSVLVPHFSIRQKRGKKQGTACARCFSFIVFRFWCSVFSFKIRAGEKTRNESRR
ncbi:MAG: hypothetical protein D6679_02770 [Candidatus Hydrogenedentota bacterium]|nr:MAG: hypothetical protein D6679_02770 [Candidatus Hydrogenedentota bacterium]